MTISVANTPLSWGVHSIDESGQSFVVVLDQIQEAGYAGTELGPWGFFPTEPELLHAELEARNLTLAGGYVRLNLLDPQTHEPGARHAVQIGRLLAAFGSAPLLLSGEVIPDSREARQAGRVRGPRLSEEEWEIFAAGVTLIARATYETCGLCVAFHHHVGTPVETSEEVRILLDRVPDDLVGLCLDTGHWRYAGGSAVDALQAFGERIWHVHLADVNPDILQFAIDEKLTFDEAMQAGIFCPLGEGDVKFPTVIDGLRRLNYDGWVVVEQDVLLEEPGADFANARSNREYLRKLGL